MANILIVEDDPRVAQAVAARLQQSGHRCEIDNDGASALQRAKSGEPDLLVLDVMLPKMSGFEICRQFRRDLNLYQVPILILSAMGNEEEVLHGLAQGADDYVTKPFDVNKLAQHVESLLRSRKNGKGIDELTGLPDADATKRELQRMICQHEPFAVLHCELLGAREFGKTYGNEIRLRAIRHLGRAFASCGEELKAAYFFAGHMGGGHFMGLAPREHAARLCDWVQKVWDRHVQKLYASAGIAEHGAPGAARLDLLLCVTVNEPSEADTTPQRLFEILSQIRHNALESAPGGTFVDRRVRLS